MTRRATLVAAVAASACAASAAAPGTGRADIDPVRLTVTAPGSVVVGRPLTIRVDVAADPGAFDSRDGDVRMQVRLATPECGGSFLGTNGPTIIDSVLRPQPGAGAYAATATATTTTTIRAPATLTVCAFVDDAEDRQFVTDVETQVAVVAAGSEAQRRAAARKRIARHRAARHRRRARRHARFTG